MAKQILCIPAHKECKEFEQLGNSMSTYFKTNNKGELVLKWKREVKTFQEFKEKMTVIIDCWGNFPDVYKFQYPKNPYKIISMMFGSPIVYPNREELENGRYRINSSYREIFPESVGLFGNYARSQDGKIEFESLYQAEGEVQTILLLDKSLTLKEFKKGLIEINKELKRIDQEENFTINIPDKGLLIDYMQKYKWYLWQGLKCLYSHYL